ncbi:hypothetical protein H9078_004209 [Salmonella enterica]|nr:hypothetical protein [Salmonella enterica]
MHKSTAQLVSILRQVSLSLNTEPLQQCISLREITEETDKVVARLSGGKRVTPAQIYRLCALLWMARMKAVEVYGRHSDVVMSLERQTDLLEAAGNVLKQRWFYRPWGSSKASVILTGILVIPVFLVLSGLLNAGYPGLLCIIVSGCYFPGIAACSLRAKDPVGLCWSVFSFILLYLLLKK